MDAPGDGDGNSSDDGLIAKVIPLRRRRPGDAWEEAYDPPPSDVFEPPRDPEPIGEYSVWDTPTAELVRREPRRPRDPPVEARLKLPRGVQRHRWLALAAIVAVGLGVVALAAVPSGRRGHSPVSLGGLNSSAGLGPTLGGVATSGRSTSRLQNTTADRQARNRTAAAGTRRRLAAARLTRPPDRVSSSISTSSNVAYSGPSSTAPPSTTAPSANGAGAPAIATAAREFGFER